MVSLSVANFWDKNRKKGRDMAGICTFQAKNNFRLNVFVSLNMSVIIGRSSPFSKIMLFLQWKNQVKGNYSNLAVIQTKERPLEIVMKGHAHYLRVFAYLQKKNR